MGNDHGKIPADRGFRPPRDADSAPAVAEVGPFPDREIPIRRVSALGRRQTGVLLVRPVGDGLVASGEADGSISVLDLDAERKIAELAGPRRPPVVAIAAGGDGLIVAAWKGSRTVRVWDFGTGRVDEVLRPGPPTNLVPVGGGRVGCAIENREIEIWNPAELTGGSDALSHVERLGRVSPYFAYTFHVGGWRQTAMTPLGDGRVASARGSAVHIWNPSDPGDRRVIELTTRPVRALVALSPDRLVVGDESGGVLEIDLADEPGARMVWNCGEPLHDVFALSAAEVAVATDRGQVFVLSCETLSPTGSFQLHLSPRFAPIGGSKVVIGFKDGEVGTLLVDSDS